MNIETREVWIDYKMRNDPNAFKEYEAFGWQHTQDVHRGRSDYAVLARDKDMPNYYRIVELDDQYFALKKKLKHYEKMSFSTFLLCLIIFIIPGIIYWLFKYLQKVSVRTHNDAIYAQMDALAQEARSLLKPKQ